MTPPPLYFATPSSPGTLEAMRGGLIGELASPAHGYATAGACPWAADNDCFSGSFDGERYIRWLAGQARHARMCWFATAPDVLGDAAATLDRSAPWLPRIREAGYRPALVAQEGLSGLDVPWGTFDVLFLGGRDRWKLGPEALALTLAARARGVPVHMGRVNGVGRWRYAEWLGCASVDGTFLRFGPDRNLPQLLRWEARLRRQPPMFGVEAS